MYAQIRNTRASAGYVRCECFSLERKGQFRKISNYGTNSELRGIHEQYEITKLFLLEILLPYLESQKDYFLQVFYQPPYIQINLRVQFYLLLI